MIKTQPMNVGVRGLFALGGSGVLALLLTTPALAHHPTGNQTPSTFIEGFLSGLGHPVIGLDHLAFVVAAGLLAATRPRGIWCPVAFVLAALVGTGIHLQQISLPGAELLISASVLAIGLLLALDSQQLSTGAMAGLAALAGIFHGYAYGESIIGATPAPLTAYLLGFTTIQLGISVAAFWLSRYGLSLKAATEAQASPNLRKAGWAIGGIGLALTYAQVLG
ncbi:MAG: hypothetical protein RLZZ597_1279 [Cyanobacteriota bacterium]|jgi:urease accessory protein